jgi:hypothetical protein
MEEKELIDAVQLQLQNEGVLEVLKNQLRTHVLQVLTKKELIKPYTRSPIKYQSPEYIALLVAKDLLDSLGLSQTAKMLTAEVGWDISEISRESLLDQVNLTDADYYDVSDDKNRALLIRLIDKSNLSYQSTTQPVTTSQIPEITHTVKDTELKPPVKEAEIAHIVEEAELRPLVNEAEFKPFARETDLMPLVKETELKHFEKETELRPLEKKTELRPLEKKAELKPFARETDLMPLKKETELRPLVKETELGPFARETELRPLENEAELGPFTRETELRPLEKEAELKPFAREKELKSLANETVLGVNVDDKHSHFKKVESTSKYSAEEEKESVSNASSSARVTKLDKKSLSMTRSKVGWDSQPETDEFECYEVIDEEEMVEDKEDLLIRQVTL